MGVVKAAISAMGHRAVLPTTKSGDDVKLLVDAGGSRVRIEVNFVFRGTVLSVVRRPLISAAQLFTTGPNLSVLQQHAYAAA